MKRLFIFSVLVAIAVGFAACGGSGSKSSDNTIKSFVVNGVPYEITGTNITNSYTKTDENKWTGLPAGLIAPEITLSSDKATIDPPANQQQDFRKSGEIVQYTVTAEDGSSKTYKVIVTLGTL